MSKIVFTITEAQRDYLRAIADKQETRRFDYRTWTNAYERGYVAGSWLEPKLTAIGRSIVATLKALEAKK